MSPLPLLNDLTRGYDWCGAQGTGYELTSLHAKGNGICQPGLRLPVALCHVIHSEYLFLFFVFRDGYYCEDWQLYPGESEMQNSGPFSSMF